MTDENKIPDPYADKDFEWKKFDKDRIEQLRRDVEEFKREKRKELQSMRRSYNEQK